MCHEAQQEAGGESTKTRGQTNMTYRRKYTGKAENFEDVERELCKWRPQCQNCGAD